MPSRGGPAQQDAGAGAQHGDQRHLDHRPRHRDMLHRQQVAGAEMQAHAEHQQHHADIGQLQDQMLVDVETRRERSHHHAREQVAHQRRQLQPVGGGPEDKSQAQAGGDDGNQGRNSFHGRDYTGISLRRATR